MIATSESMYKQHRLDRDTCGLNYMNGSTQMRVHQLPSTSLVTQKMGVFTPQNSRPVTCGQSCLHNIVHKLIRHKRKLHSKAYKWGSSNFRKNRSIPTQTLDEAQ